MERRRITGPCSTGSSQFNLTPLAQTDTAVASLKLHLLSQYLHYPFDALVESFSPTTGWNLTQLPPEIRERFERVQEVELESAPDGPYQYLCGRIDPYRQGDRTFGYYRSFLAPAQCGHAL